MVRTTTTSAGSDFFEALQVWSDAKLRILTKYLGAYFRKRGRFNPTFYYVDGFAGAGLYDANGPNQAEGSPLRVARMAQEIADTGKPYKLVCINVEADPKRHGELSNQLSQFDPSLVQVLRGDFVSHLGTILTNTKGHPAVFFLDPFGVKEITPLRVMAPIINRPNTEVFLTFNTFRLHLLAGSDDSQAREARGKIRLVSEVFGDQPDDPAPMWLQEWQRAEGQRSAVWRQWAAEHYAQRLRERSKYLKYSIAYPMRPEYNHIPKYHLVFASRVLDPIPIINDLLCTEEDKLFDDVKLGVPGQMDMFAGTDFDRVRVQLSSLTDELYEFGLLHQRCTREDIYAAYALKHPMRYKMRHHRAALDQLVELGKARFLGSKADQTPIEFLSSS